MHPSLTYKIALKSWRCFVEWREYAHFALKIDVRHRSFQRDYKRLWGRFFFALVTVVGVFFLFFFFLMYLPLFGSLFSKVYHWRNFTSVFRYHEQSLGYDTEYTAKTTFALALTCNVSGILYPAGNILNSCNEETCGLKMNKLLFSWILYQFKQSLRLYMYFCYSV